MGVTYALNTLSWKNPYNLARFLSVCLITCRSLKYETWYNIYTIYIGNINMYFWPIVFSELNISDYSETLF